MIKIRTLPEFGDKEMILRAQVFFKLVTGSAVLVTLIVGFEIFALPQNYLRWIFIICSIDIVSLGLLLLNRKGKTLLASYLFASLLMVLIFGLSWSAGGIKAPAIQEIPIVVLAVGLILGWKKGALYAAGTTAACIGLVVVESFGFLPVSKVVPTSLSVLANSTMQVGLLVLLQYLIVGNLDKTLHEAKDEVARRAKAEAALRESEERFHLVLDNMPILLNAFDHEGMLIFWNKACEETTGYTADEVIGNPHAMELLYPDSEYRAKVWNSSLDPSNKENVYDLVNKKGERRTIEWFDIYHRLRVPAWPSWGMGQDITDRKRAEEALKASESRLRAVLDNTHDAIGVHVNGVWEMCNTAAVRLFRFSSPQDLLGKSILGVIAPNERSRISDFVRNRKEGNDAPLIYLTRGLRADGSEFDMDVALSSFKLENKLHVLVILRDITERMQSEHALRQSEGMLRAMFEASRDAISVSKKGINIYVNPSYLKLFGYESNDNIAGASILDSIAPSHRQQMMQNVERRYAGEPVSKFYEARGMKVDGTEFDAEFSVSTYELNNEIYSLAVIRDITERKAAEEALRFERLLLRTLIDNIPDSIYSKDISCRKTLANLAEVRNLGVHSEADVLGKTDFELYPKELAEGFFADDQLVLQTGQPVINREEYIFDQKGEKRWLLTSKLPLRDKEGRTIGLVGIGHDITDRQQAEDQLRKLSLAVEQSPASIVITDTRGNIEYVNPKFTQVTGYTIEEARGKNPRILKSGETSPEEYKKLWETISAGKDWRGEFHNKKKNGELYWELASISPVKNGENIITNFLAVKEDITERKQVEEALRHAQKLESIGTLAGGIAHDFNNLLNAILGQSTLAMNKISKENPAKDHIEKSIKAAERAADLTRHLLAYSGKGKFVTEEIDLNRLVEENIQILEVSVPKTAQLSFDLGSPSPHLHGDVGQIQQVIMNLIINAGEAIAPNPGNITVHSGRVELMENDTEYWKYTHTPLSPGTYASLRVNDTGHGIKPDVLARIFDPFFTTKFTGRGLGLAAVLGIVRGHHGGLRIESKEGKGTEFEVIFPLVHVSTITSAPEKKQGTVVNGEGKTVLVIDDEASILELLKDIFTEANFAVIEASNPMEGIELYRQHQKEIAVVILDYSMPGMDGKAAFEELVKIKKDVRVMLCSGYTEEEIISAFGDIRPHAFIQKPYKPVQLLETVSKILHTKRTPRKEV